MNTLGFRLLILALILVAPASAQEREPSDAGTRIDPSGIISGRLDDDNPREVYFIDGLRGEVIQFALSATDGDLDPVLAIFDSRGQLEIYQDDGANGLDVAHELTLKANGRYFVVVARFGYQLGSTAGEFELRLTRAGVISEEGSALRYGDSVIGTISQSEPQAYYTFEAKQGDIVNISMVRSSGDLDPYLKVINGQRFVIAENDDHAGSESRNALIESLIINQSDTYIIMATRYRESAGESSGSFVLSIEEADNSGTGALQLAPLPIAYGETRAGLLSHLQYQRFYAFEAARNDLVSISMSRGSAGELDSYLILADAHFTPIVEDDDSGAGQNAQIADYPIPADGAYHIIATRFEGSKGSSIGEFLLSLDVFGDAEDAIPADAINISYGTSVPGKISAENGQDLYAFYARQGEIITVSMTRVDGDLDAFLELLNGSQELLLSNDDGGNGQNALIDNYTIPRSGLYFIRARRFFGENGNPNTAGGYVLVLAERFG